MNSSAMTRVELIQQGRRLAQEAIENVTPDCSWMYMDDIAEGDVAAAIRAVACDLAEVARKALEI